MTAVVLAPVQPADLGESGSASSAAASSRMRASPWIMIPCSSRKRSARSTSTVQRGSRRRLATFWPRQYAHTLPPCHTNHSGVALMRPDGDTVEMRMFHSEVRMSSCSSGERARSRERAMAVLLGRDRWRSVPAAAVAGVIRGSLAGGPGRGRTGAPSFGTAGRRRDRQHGRVLKSS